MKFLTITNNPNFIYKEDGTLYSSDNPLPLDKIEPNTNTFFYNKSRVSIFASGALVVKKIANEIEVSFYTSDGKPLFKEKAVDLDDIGATLYDMDAVVCSSGVILDKDYGRDDHDFIYYLYNGSVMKDQDIYRLQEKIDRYENNLGIFSDPVKKAKQTEICKFTLEMLNQEPGLE